MAENKPTFKVEQFPDGTFEVPLVRSEDGPTIGLAKVTFKDGLWSALITLNDEDAVELGINLTFLHVSNHQSSHAMLIAKTYDEEY